MIAKRISEYIPEIRDVIKYYCNDQQWFKETGFCGWFMTTWEAGDWIPFVLPPGNPRDIAMQLEEMKCMEEEGCEENEWYKKPGKLTTLVKNRIRFHSLRFPDGRIWDTKIRGWVEQD